MLGIERENLKLKLQDMPYVEEAWSILEGYASGRFEVVADYVYKDLWQFFCSAVGFVKGKKKAEEFMVRLSKIEIK